jgi:hypothetical protein
MLQMFYLNVAYVAVAMHICFFMAGYAHLLQACVPNVSPVLTYVAVCFMLQVFSLAGSMDGHA